MTYTTLSRSKNKIKLYSNNSKKKKPGGKMKREGKKNVLSDERS